MGGCSAQPRGGCLLFLTGDFSVYVAVLVVCIYSGLDVPAGEGIGQVFPLAGAAFHLVFGEQAGVELFGEFSHVQTDADEDQLLAAVCVGLDKVVENLAAVFDALWPA